MQNNKKTYLLFIRSLLKYSQQTLVKLKYTDYMLIITNINQLQKRTFKPVSDYCNPT